MKLIRDKIPEIMEKQGKKMQTRVADDGEYETMLVKKLQEEVAEFAYDRNIEELADILEVMRCFAELKGIEWSAIEEMRAKKNDEKGSFRKRIVLERVS